MALLCAASLLPRAFFSPGPAWRNFSCVSSAPSAAWAADGIEWRATGKGRIKTDDAQGLMLARRAALTDARRNLLLKRGYEVGRVGPHRVASEWREEEIYYVEVVAKEND